MRPIAQPSLHVYRDVSGLIGLAAAIGRFGERRRLYPAVVGPASLALLALLLTACAHTPAPEQATEASPVAVTSSEPAAPPADVTDLSTTEPAVAKDTDRDDTSGEVALDEYVSQGQTLVLAARYGQVDKLRHQGSSIDARDELGYTALIAAAGESSVEVLDLILNEGADVDAQTDEGTTALMMAAAKGYLANVQRLLAAGARVDLRNNEGEDALMAAIRFGHAAIVDTLLEAGADANPYTQEEILSRDLETPLMLAARVGSSLTAGVRIVRSLLAHGAEPNLIRPNGDTAMTIAQRQGSALIVAELRRHGARDESPYALLSQEEALLKAIELGDDDKARELIVAAADPNYRNHITGVSPLLSAAFHGREAVVEALVEHGAEINDVPFGLSPMRINSSNVPVSARPLVRAASRGDTPLIAALRGHHSEIALFLIEHGAIPALPNRQSETPGQLAAKYGEVEVMRALLDHGLDPDLDRLPAIEGFSIANIVRREPIRPILIEAAIHGQAPVIELLLEHGANPDIRDKDGRTALSWAASEGWLESVNALLAGEADPNLSDNEHVTPLMQAARSGYLRIVEALVDHGANVNVVDGVSQEDSYRPLAEKRGNTALMLAARGGHADIVEYLLAHGALADLRTASGEDAAGIARRYGHIQVAQLIERARSR